MRFRTVYNRDHKKEAGKYATFNEGEDLCQQTDRRETDINFIVNTYAKTGTMPQLMENPTWGDFSDVGDFRSALERVRHAEETFAQIPAKIRKEFDNDPAKFIEFASNPQNADKLVEYGLAVKKLTESTPPANPPATKEE